MLAKKQASRGMLEPAAAAAMAVDPSVRLRSIDCNAGTHVKQAGHTDKTIDHHLLLHLRPPGWHDGCSPRAVIKLLSTCSSDQPTWALVPALLALMENTLPDLSSSMPGSQHTSQTLVVCECSTDDRYLRSRGIRQQQA